MITITYNENEEMMVIKNNEEVVFYGNYWDFDKSPHGLKSFIENLGLQTELIKTKKRIS